MTFWTRETIARLTELVDAGKTSGEIAYIMQISRNSVVSKVKRLPGLSFATAAFGGHAGKMVFSPTERADIIELLRNGFFPSRIADSLGIAYDRVLKLMEEENIPRPPKRTSLGRRAQFPRKPSTPAPEQARPAMIVADARQTPLSVPKPRVVPFPIAGTRTCQWLEGDVVRGASQQALCGLPVAHLGCSWCSVHRKRVFQPMRAGAGEAAD